MSESLEFSLIHFIIADIQNRKEIWTYNSANRSAYQELQKSIKKCKDVINDDSLVNPNNQNLKNKKISIPFEKNLILHYIINKENLIFMGVISCNCNINNSNTNTLTSSIFEFIEDIQYQGILKLQDKNAELNNVGKQNLMLLIDKYFSNQKLNNTTRSNNSSSNSIPINFTNNFDSFSVTGSNNNKNTSNNTETNSDSKISKVTSDVNEIKIDMKRGIKKIVQNVDHMQELEVRAEGIKNTSLLFRKDAELLKNRTRWQNLKFKIFMGLFILLVVGFVVYTFFF